MYNDHKVKPLHIMLPKTSAYVKSFDRQTKWMYFLIEDDNTTWDKVSTDTKKEFESKPVRNKESLKTKIKSHADEVTDFHDKKIPKVDSNNTFLAVISFGLCSQERLKLLSASLFLKSVNVLRKK